MPGNEKTDLAEHFSPAFPNRWRGFICQVSGIVYSGVRPSRAQQALVIPPSAIFQGLHARNVCAPETGALRRCSLSRGSLCNTIRFMDWMDTNGSKPKRWADRPRLEDANWATKGVPVEVMVDLWALL